MRYLSLAVLILALSAVLSGLVRAQQPMDQRLMPQTIAAQQAVLALREAEIRALQEDMARERVGYEARLETAMEWVRAAQAATAAKKGS